MSRSDGPAGHLVARRRLLLVAGLAALGLLTLTFGRMLLARHELGRRAEAVRRDIADLQAEHLRLQETLADAESAAGIEQAARQELGWAKPGETAVVLVGQERPADGPSAPPTRPPEATPNWRRWWDYLSGGPP